MVQFASYIRNRGRVKQKVNIFGYDLSQYVLYSFRAFS